MRLALLIAFACMLLVGSSCGGDSDERWTTTPVPTATPYARLPQPTIVTGDAAFGGAIGEAQTYTVVAGDALSLIAARFNVSVEELQRANNLTSSDLQLGQRLIIPRAAGGSSGQPGTATGTPAGGASTPTPLPGAGAATTYTVRPGDTAYGIALQFDTTVEAIERAHGVPPGGLSNLQLGQVVKIPPPGQR